MNRWLPKPPSEPALSVASPPEHGEQAVSASTRVLVESAERALRAPTGKLALALHLSRLRPPAPLPHHGRIARAMLADTAQRYSGQVFPLSNGDLVLLCSAPADADRLGSLPDSLGRLFGADAPDGERLVSAWRLDSEGDTFRAYLSSRQGEAPAEAASPEVAGTTACVAVLEHLIATAHLPTLLGQQTAVRVVKGHNLPLGSRLAPLFREISFSFAALARRHDTAEAVADPFLFRHLAARLDARMLEHLHADMEASGKLTRGALRQKLPLHLNLTLEGIVSPAFARLTQCARRIGARIGVEVSIMEAAADLPLMEYAASLLALADCPLVLDGLDGPTLAMTRPEVLAPSLVKLTWSPALAHAPPALHAGMRDAITRMGAQRVVLQRAETEDALVWGQAHGITRFQGHYIDAVQAAGRLAGCHSARACTLRQCVTRAGTLSPSVRAACGNPGLLDLVPQHGDAAPAPVHATVADERLAAH